MLLFSRSDIFTINLFNDEIEDPVERKAASLRLQAMVDYAESRSCRRSTLLPYFGQEYPAGSCDLCDNCRAAEPEEMVDLTIPAQMFLSCVKRTGEIFGAAQGLAWLAGEEGP